MPVEKHREAIEIIRNLFEHIKTLPARCLSSSAENISTIGFSISSSGISRGWWSQEFSSDSKLPEEPSDVTENVRPKCLVNRICCAIKYFDADEPVVVNKNRDWATILDKNEYQFDEQSTANVKFITNILSLCDSWISWYQLIDNEVPWNSFVKIWIFL